MDKADWALAIAALSALAAFWGALYARRLARNDTERMKRRPLVFEYEPTRTNATHPDWIDYLLVVRNLEPVGAIMTAIRCRTKTGAVLLKSDAYKTDGGGETDDLLTAIPEYREITLQTRIGPRRTAVGHQPTQPGDTLYLWIMTKNLRSKDDLQIIWSWADGQKR